jgi:hypothetical protein
MLAVPIWMDEVGLSVCLLLILASLTVRNKKFTTDFLEYYCRHSCFIGNNFRLFYTAALSGEFPELVCLGKVSKNLLRDENYYNLQ